MASAKKVNTRAMLGQPPQGDPLERREDGDRLAALYGLTPKVESAIVTAIFTRQRRAWFARC